MYHKLDGLKQQVYCLIVLETRSPKSKCQIGHAPSENCRRESSPFHGLSATFNIPWLAAPALKSMLLLSQGILLLCLCVSSILIRTLVILRTFLTLLLFLHLLLLIFFFFFKSEVLSLDLSLIALDQHQPIKISAIKGMFYLCCPIW